MIFNSGTGGMTGNNFKYQLHFVESCRDCISIGLAHDVDDFYEFYPENNSFDKNINVEPIRDGGGAVVKNINGCEKDSDKDKLGQKVYRYNHSRRRILNQVDIDMNEYAPAYVMPHNKWGAHYFSSDPNMFIPSKPQWVEFYEKLFYTRSNQVLAMF
jgi:hypothetical protein